MTPEGHRPAAGRQTFPLSAGELRRQVLTTRIIRKKTDGVAACAGA